MFTVVYPAGVEKGERRGVAGSEDLAALEIKNIASPIEMVDLNPSTVLLRWRRPTAMQYAAFSRVAAKQGHTMVCSLGDYCALTNYSVHYELLKDHSPKSVVVESSAPVTKIVTLVENEGLAPPLFFKTELGSAAKYSGIDACVSQSIQVSEISKVIKRTLRALPNATSFQIKEGLSLRSAGGGPTTEARTVGWGGGLRHVSQAAGDSIADGDLEVFSDGLYRLLQGAGIGGPAVIDVDQDTDGRLWIVEVKDLGSSSLPGFVDVAVDLARHCEAIGS